MRGHRCGSSGFARAAAAVVVVLLVASGVGGCGPAKTPPVGAESPSATSSSPATPAVSSSSAGATSPIAQTADAPRTSSSWLISAKGIGPYLLGGTYQSTQEQPADVGGGPCPFRTVDDPTHGQILLYWHSDGTQTPNPDGSFQAGVVISTVGYPSPGAVPADPPRTAEGVGLGSTRAQVEAAYPDAVPTERPYTGDALLITLDGVPILFDFDGTTKAPTDPVTQIEVGQKYPADEFCG